MATIAAASDDVSAGSIVAVAAVPLAPIVALGGGLFGITPCDLNGDPKRGVEGTGVVVGGVAGVLVEQRLGSALRCTLGMVMGRTIACEEVRYL